MTPTSNTPYSQEATLAERLVALEEERLAGTRSAYTNITNPEPSGRWKKPAQPSDPSKLYPPIPGGPWGSGPQVPDEPPLGFSVNDLEPCGELHELQRSAATDNLQGGSCGEAGYSSPATAADLPPLLGLAEGPSPMPEATSPVGSDDSATDPTLGSSDPSLLRDQQLGPSSDTLADHVCEGKRDARVEPAVSRKGSFPKSWRRLGR
jgi:hypothetical protein